MKKKKPTDADLLDWLEKNEGCNLISDDAGRWAVSTSGIQQAPMNRKGFKETISVGSWIEPHEWKKGVREAIRFSMKEE